MFTLQILENNSVFIAFLIGTKIAYGHFASGQGNNHNSGFLFTSGSSDDCALLRRDDGGQWHDYPCHPPIANIGYHYSYACEFRKQLYCHISLHFERST